MCRKVPLTDGVTSCSPERESPVVVSRRLVRLRMLALALSFAPGCIGAQLKFATVIEKTGPGPGGWQEACLEARIENMTIRDSHICTVGIGLPIETRETGYVAPWMAEEIATDCINKASDEVIRPAPPESPSALVCMSFKDTLSQLLNERILGSRVTLGCRKGVPLTRVGF
jgi:hypothetical protein